MHYEPVRYDLNDLVARGQALIAKFSNDTQGKIQMQQMAAAAGSKALEAFNLVGQLDALVYAVQKVTKDSIWCTVFELSQFWTALLHFLQHRLCACKHSNTCLPGQPCDIGAR